MSGKPLCVVRTGGDLGFEGWMGFPKAEVGEGRRGLPPTVGEEETASKAQRWENESPSQGLKSNPNRLQWKEESVGSLLSALLQRPARTWKKPESDCAHFLLLLQQTTTSLVA